MSNMNGTMEMAQLQAFVAVAEAGGFSRAASLLYSTQPTISRQVKSLEKDLGKPLFDRLGRRVELTQFGRECLDHARGILAQVEALSQSAEQKSGTAAGSYASVRPIASSCGICRSCCGAFRVDTRPCASMFERLVRPTS